MRRIRLYTPVSSRVFDAVAAQRCAGIHLPEDVEVQCCSLNKGPTSIETMYDEDCASAALYEEILSAGRESLPMDALVVNCFADPGVDGLRELLDIPVVGVGQSAFALAMQLAPRFSVLSVEKNSIPHTWQRLSKFGILQRCVSVYGLEIPPAQLGQEKDAAMAALLQYGKKAIEEDGADGLVLGCTGMADLGSALQAKLQVPVVEPTGAGLWMAVALLNLQLTHGRQWMYQKADPDKMR